MNITKFDITIVVVMSLSIVSMSFVFPALGLSDINTKENDIPELNVSENAFDFASQFPDRPRSVDGGIITYRADGLDDRDIDLLVEGQNLVVSTSAFAEGNGNTTPIRVFLTEFGPNGGTQIDQANLTLNNTGEVGELTVDNQTEYTVRYTLIETRNSGTDQFEAQVQFEVTDSPGTDGFLGTIFGAADTLASTLAWIGTVFYWISVTIVQTTLNVLSAILSVITYIFSLFGWLSGTYASVITSAPSWVGIFVSIPGILLTFTLSKMVIIGIKSLPTT